MALALAVLAAGCGSGTTTSQEGRTLLVVVNAPLSVSPEVGAEIVNGSKLAAQQINAGGGISTGDGVFRLRVQALDNGLSPQKALANVRRAVEEGAVAVVDEGTGVDASWPVAGRAHVPICIVYQGGIGLVDPVKRPNVFRIAPTDHGIAFRLAEYLVPKGSTIALLHDDTGYGQQGADALHEAFGFTPRAVAADMGLASSSEGFAPEVLRARRSGALVVWGVPMTVAQVIRDARSSGWNVPVYTPPAGEDPVVRQQLSDHPEWVDGVTFASGRMTAERGPGPFLSFQSAYERAFGRKDVGVQTRSGQEVFQPPDYAMYPYDFVNVLADAIRAAREADGRRVIAALNEVDVRGANGDERGFNEKNHEGVVADDVYFAVFRDMTFRPVEDDPLSSTLPVIPQTR